MDYISINLALYCKFTFILCISIFLQKKNGHGIKNRVYLYGDGSGVRYILFDWGRAAMVNFLRKKEKGEVFANGRIIVTDFKKLKKEDFPQYENGDMFFLHYDGKIYLDSEDEANEAVIMLLKMLIQYPRSELLKMEKERKRRYPNIKTAEDLAQLKEDNEAFMNALAMFIIPLEIKSREMEKAYYG